MTENPYEEVASIVSRIRNARFADMVNQLEQLIDSGIWREFTTPIGTHFTFQPCEFDYFLAAQEIDPTTVKYAYLKAEGVEHLPRSRPGSLTLQAADGHLLTGTDAKELTLHGFTEVILSGAGAPSGHTASRL